MKFSPMFLVIFGVLAVVAQNNPTIYPPDLRWTSTGRSTPPGRGAGDFPKNVTEYYDFVGTLEFCKPDNAEFGYRDANSRAPCSSPGPTLRMITGYNYLMYFRIGDADMSSLNPAVTNIHTHGLMVSGSENADDISRTIGPDDDCLAYNYTVLHDHAGGLCWYHSHPHGSTNPQVSQGAYGALIIGDQDADGNWPQFPADNAFGLQALCDHKHERILFMGSVGSDWHMNGQEGGTILQPILESTWYRLRLLVSQPAGTRADPFYDTNADDDSKCEFRNMAYDGHWRSSVPSDPVSDWNISAAGRMDVAFRCPKSPSGVYHHIVLGDVEAEIIVETATGRQDISSPYYNNSVWNPNTPPWQQNMTDIEVNATNQHSVALSPTAVTYDDKQYSYDASKSTDTWEYGSVLQFTVSRSNVHPFHLHAFPMQIIEGCSPHEQGEFYDTISSLETNCVVKFRALGEPGKVPMHCHLLAHEDNGAMTWVWVEGGPDLAANPYPPVDSCDL
eukprot:CAMPEP_0201492018 /NCGR_PEP_ID=MMETSP0151_2-20130828/32020_1 /ASSEMBLY_ACC=CAM_ASM_000257 /TAXON_ID=200890 /ORGANISM="Paramoeba atlantica, Strain 621/1 / CCAP 1560/9" /LENGTH=502 /DNA_ID=CAMNT_0047878665 /DNA_START=48 /DNA_END=1556 /DNA_ORIENTATION=-